MTFINKIINAFSMNKCDKPNNISNTQDKIKMPQGNILSPNAFNYRRSDKTVDLYLIRNFWELHPQTYQCTSHEATIEEYLIYGKTLMLWAYGKCSPVHSKDGYPYYFTTECHISNPLRLHVELIYDEYLIPSDIFEVLGTYKMTELKIIAESIGCKKNGTKAELIHRIVDNMSPETVEELIKKNKLYSLSPKGISFLDANSDYIKLHKHRQYRISLSEFNKNRFPDNHHRRTFEDNAYTFISQRIYENSASFYYYMMESDYNALYEIALSEHLYDIALDSYLRKLYLKSCCIQIAQYYNAYSYYGEHDFDHTIIFTVHNAPPLTEFKHIYTATFVSNIFKDLSLPPSFMTQKEFAEMIEEMMDSISFDYDKYNKLIISRLKKY